MNKNRVISFILAMVMSFSILAEARIPVMAVSDDGTTGEITTVTETETGSEENKCGENAYWRYDSETSSVVIYGTGPMYDYTLDQSTQRTDTPWDTLVNSHVVIEEGITYIGEYAFSGLGFTEITIPDSVESIGNRAFYNCTFLTDIHVGEGLKSDISAAFEGCTALKNVHIPDLEYWLEEDRNLYLAIFDTSALKVCTFNLYINGEKVTDIVIPDSVTKIRANAFRNQDITSVTIHNNVTEIGDYAFAHYWNGSFAANPLLTTVVIPDSVVTIGDYAFYGNCNLKDITVSANLEKIGKYAFADCSGLSAIDIPATVSVIDNYAFAGCSGVTTINIPASLQYIGDCAFTGIDKVYTYVELPETVTYLGKTPFGTAITEMILPDSLETIGDSAFAGCTALTAITLPADLTTIGDYAFDGCTSLATINIPDKVESIGEAAFRNCTSLTTVALPDSVTTLGAYAFYASGILNIDMSANLTEIQPYTFYECNFTAIDIPDTVVKIDSYAFYGCDQLGELVLPSKLEYVGNHAFKNCYVMTTGELPQTITFIGDHGFDDCHKMVITKLPAGLTALNQYVFRGCHAFTEITIPAAVESLKGAFYCCFGLKEIYFEGDAPTIDYNSFGGVTGTCYYPKGNTTYTSGITGSSYGGTLNWVELGAETSDKCGENITWELSDDGVLTLTGTGAMYDYDGTNAVYAPWYNQKTAIKSVEISDGITHLGKQAFSACSNLTAVSIPETVVSAGTYVFEKCTSLTSVVLPDGLTYIPEGMFSGCSNLVDVDFPETITTIGDSAFGGCTQLGSVVLPEGLVSIGEEAFNGCGYTDWGYNSTGYNFTSVTLPSTVKTIGKGAFKSCNSLTTINIPYGVTSIGEYAFGRAGISSIIIPSTVTSVGTGTFRWCKRLKTAYFYGDAPEFGSDMFGLMEGQKTTVYYPGSNETWTADLIAIHDNYYCDFVAWEATDEPGAGGGSGGGAGDNEGDDSQTGGGSEGSGTEGGDSSGTTGGTGSGDGSDGSETGGTGGTGSEGSDGDGTGGEGSGTGTGGTGTAETFTLTFDLNGRELASIYSAPQPVEVSGELTSLKGLLPTGESTDGCCLVGWYYEPECITPLTLETDIIEKDITVYAKWLEHTSTPSDLPVEKPIVAQGRCGENLTWTLDENGLLTIRGTGDMYDYSYYKVAPWSELDVKTVNITDGVTSIGRYAFSDCDTLTEVTMADSVTSIGERAFYYCKYLTEITIPGSVETIEDYMFYNCIRLEKVTIESGVKTIGESAFGYCESLTQLTLPDTLTTIESEAIRCCYSLAEITLPENLKTIGINAFGFSEALKEITIPDGIETIESYTFCFCTALTKITIPASVKTIKHDAFLDSYNLATVCYDGTQTQWDAITIESGNEILTTAQIQFNACEITVIQPENGTVAVDKTIAAPGETVTITATPADGYNLNQILVDGCPIQETTFEVRCDHTVTAEFVVDNIVNGTCGENLIWELDKSTGLLTISGNGAMDDYSYTSETVGEEIVLSTTAPWSVWGDWITSVVIGSGVTHIGEFAFSYMDRLTGSLTIPDTVTSIGKQAFYCCSGLTGDLTIPDSVTDIGEMAFANCEGFNGTLTLPENLTEIKDSVFSYCSFTGTLTIPAGVTSIGMGAFGGNKFKTIELPEGLLSIGKAAFQNNKKRVGQLTIPDSVTTIGAGAFTGCQGLTSVVFGTGLTTFVEDEWSTPLFGECTLIEKVTFYGTTPATITEISNPFSGMTGLKQIYVPMASYNKYVSRYSAFVAETVEFVAIEPEGTCGENLKWKITSDGTLTISGTGKMYDYSWSYNNYQPWYSYRNYTTKVVVEDGVTNIGNQAFYSLSYLKDVSLAETITSIGNSAFSGCSALTSITIPSAVIEIQSDAFISCYSLVSIELSEKLTTIGGRAFSTCTALEDIELPDSLTYIGGEVFKNCSALKEINIPAGITTIGKNAFKTGTTMDVYYASTKSSWDSKFTEEAIGNIFTNTPVMHYGKYDITVTQPEDGTIAVDKTIAAPDETVTVTVTPNRYRRLDAIYVNDQPITGNTFMPQADSVVTATFNKVKYTVKLSTDGKFTTDAYLVVEAEDSLADKLPTPADTAVYEFGGWYKDADCTQPWDTATDMVTDDTTLYAKAILKSYTATVQQAENGTVTLDKQVYSAGETVTITAAPNLDYELDKIYVNGAEIAGNTFIIVEDSTVTASFKRIVVNNAVTNLTASQTFSKTVVLTWNKHTDSRVVSYTISRDGVAIGTTQECMFVDRNLIPETQYQYSVTANTAGTVTSPAKEITVKTALPVIKSITTGTIKNKINDENNTIRINVVNSGNLGALNDEEKTTGILYLNDGQDYPLIGAGELHTDSTGSWYTVEWDVTNVADGEYNVTFVLTDADLAEAEYTETILVDRSTPEKINQLVATGQVSRIILSWTKATEVDTIQYNIYRRAADEDEFTLLKTVNGRDTLTYADTTALEDVEYTYYIAGVNEFEQEGTPSDTVVASLSKDKEKPTVTKITPANMSYINGTVTFNVIAQDNAGVVKTELYYSVDDQTSWIQMPDMSKTFSLAFDTETLEDGVVYIKGIAYDEAGNVSDGLTYKYMIDNTGPQQVTNLSYESTSVTVTLKWDDVADEDVKFFRVERMMDDGTYVKLADVYSTLGYNIYGLQPDTQYTYRVTAYDHVGNAGQPSEDIVAATLADTTAPVVTNISPNPGSWSTGIDLAITAKDENTVAEITVQVSTDALTWTDVYTAAFTDGNKSRTARYTLSLDGYEDGYIYVRGIAKDAAGNESDSSIDAPYTQHKIDKTAPAAPAGLTATGYAGYIEIKWSADSSDNISSYSVYRADAADGEYTLLANVKTLNYFDRTVESNVTYYYKAEAVDIAGNKSDCSEAVSAMSAVDEEKPYLVNFAPATGSTVGIGNRTVGASFTDNGELAKVVIEISKDGESYTLLTEKTEIGSYGAIVEGKIPVDEFADGETVYIRYSAVDTAGNISEYALAEYVVDAAAPVVKTAAAEFADNVVIVSWTGAQESDLAGYKIYRRDSAESEYSIIGQAAVNSTAAQYIYKDINLSEEEITYFYMIEAVDKNGNTAQFETAPITLPERGIPVPELNCETALENGVEYIFDASESRDNGTIVSYFFDFGDGTTSTKAKAFHKYDEVGDYTITLTVTDNLGNTATITKNISVKEQKMLGKLKVLVVDETGVPVPGASVYMDLGEEYQVKKQTDSNGYVTFTAEVGKHEIGVIIPDNEWLPTAKEVVVRAGQETDVSMTLVHHPLMEANFTVNRMTFDDIKRAGIDVSDPANHHVFEVVFSFMYNDIPTTTSSYYNPTTNKWTPKPGNGGSGYDNNGGSGYDNEDDDSDGKLVEWDVLEKDEDGMPTKIAMFEIAARGSFLKEFFDVRMVLVNNSAAEFSMQDNIVSLNAPEGMTVVTTNGQEGNQVVKIDEIRGQTSEVIAWILRGDKEGEYHLTADYAGTLARFNERITTQFATEDPVKVYGTSAIKLIAEGNNSIFNGAFYFNLTILNKGDVEIYLPRFNLINDTIKEYQLDVAAGEVEITNPDVRWLNTVLTNSKGFSQPIGRSAEVERLAPGESLTRKYAVYNVSGYKNVLYLKTAVAHIAEEYGIECEARAVEMDLYDMNNVEEKFQAFKESCTDISKMSMYDYLCSNANFMYTLEAIDRRYDILENALTEDYVSIQGVLKGKLFNKKDTISDTTRELITRLLTSETTTRLVEERVEEKYIDITTNLMKTVGTVLGDSSFSGNLTNGDLDMINDLSKDSAAIRKLSGAVMDGGKDGFAEELRQILKSYGLSFALNKIDLINLIDDTEYKKELRAQLKGMDTIIDKIDAVSTAWFDTADIATDLMYMSAAGEEAKILLDMLIYEVEEEQNELLEFLKKWFTIPGQVPDTDDIYYDALVEIRELLDGGYEELAEKFVEELAKESAEGATKEVIKKLITTCLGGKAYAIYKLLGAAFDIVDVVTGWGDRVDTNYRLAIDLMTSLALQNAFERYGGVSVNGDSPSSKEEIVHTMTALKYLIKMRMIGEYDFGTTAYEQADDAAEKILYISNKAFDTLLITHPYLAGVKSDWGTWYPLVLDAVSEAIGNETFDFIVGTLNNDDLSIYIRDHVDEIQSEDDMKKLVAEYTFKEKLDILNNRYGTDYADIDEYINGTMTRLAQYRDSIFSLYYEDLNIPEAPDVAIDYMNKSTVDAYSSDYEFSYDGIKWFTASGETINVEPGSSTKWLWVRKKATDKSPAGNIAKAAIAARPVITGDISMVYENGKYVVTGLPAGTYRYEFTSDKNAIFLKDTFTVTSGQAVTLEALAGHTYLAIQFVENSGNFSSQIRYLTKENAWVVDDEARQMAGFRERTKAEELKTYYLNQGLQMTVENTKRINGYIGTGTKVSVGGFAEWAFTAVVKGDTTGDGMIEIDDVVEAIKQVTSEDYLEAEFLDAGRIVEREEMSLLDILAMMNYIENGSFAK